MQETEFRFHLRPFIFTGGFRCGPIREFFIRGEKWLGFGYNIPQRGDYAFYVGFLYIAITTSSFRNL
jgi:hypothetical protein